MTAANAINGQGRLRVVAPVSGATDSEISPERPPDEATPRKRGRPKGLGKVPGSGRKKGTQNVDLETLTAKAEQFALDVLEGKEFTVRGPTGKIIKQSASLETRVKVAMGFIDKKHADRKDVTSGGEAIGQTDWYAHLKGPFADVRDMADRVNLLRALRAATRHNPDAWSQVEAWAEMAGFEHWSELFGDEPPPYSADTDSQEDSDGASPVELPALAGGGAVSASAAPSLPSPDDAPAAPLKIGESIVLSELGGWTCTLDSFDNAGTGRWWIADAGGMRHRRVTGDRDKAIAVARELVGMKARAHPEITGPTRKATHGL